MLTFSPPSLLAEGGENAKRLGMPLVSGALYLLLVTKYLTKAVASHKMSYLSLPKALPNVADICWEPMTSEIGQPCYPCSVTLG